jgi:hypothetical protein
MLPNGEKVSVQPVFLQVFDHMALLQSWFREQGSKKNNLAELYERVQWAGNVLPRL